MLGLDCPIPRLSGHFKQMKKLLLLCFLAALCLPGSSLKAQSGVAESPTGADFLHRSSPTVPHGLRDTHRGGETRPDMLQEGECSSASSDTLSIGDQIPEGMVFRHVLNNDGEPLDFDRLTKGKYTVLALWSTGCFASSASIAKIDSLSQQFREEIAFVPVTFDAEDRVSSLVRDVKFLQDVNLPMVMQDDRLYRYFPHRIVPHFVVLDRAGKIMAVTGKEDITAKMLGELLDTGHAGFRVKEDKKVDFDFKEYLISGNIQLEEKNILYQSALTHYIPGMRGSSVSKDGTEGYIRLTAASVSTLFQYAYSGNDFSNLFRRNRVEYEGFAPDEIATSKKGLDYQEWARAAGHVYNYELIVPPGQDKYGHMKEDLKRYFPQVDARVENRKRTVLALVKTGDVDFRPSQADKYAIELTEGMEITKGTFGLLAYYLNFYFQQKSPYPIVDRTGIDFETDFKIRGRLGNRESLIAGLREIGLDLVEREEEIPVLVLSKIDDPRLTAR